MRLLFFPSDLGGGFGHISRCLALALEARNRNHICDFVLTDSKYENRIKKDFNVYVLKKRKKWGSPSLFLKKAISLFLKPPAYPLFLEISDLSFQIIRDDLTSERKIRHILDQYIEIVEYSKPDVLIGDTSLLVWILSQKVGIPAIQIIRFAFHPERAGLIWWKKIPTEITPPDSLKLFNPLLKKIGLKQINKAEDLLRGDLYLVPGIPEIEPVEADTKTIHVGDLTLSVEETSPPSWFNELPSNQPLIYVTIGGGAGPVGNRSFFLTIIEAFTDKKVQVVVSTSDKFKPEDFPGLPSNIRFFSWLPGKLIISKADLIVFHGGYGTMMETISRGKPTVIIPFQTEQEGNGRRLEKHGCGRVLKLSREKYKKINKKWEYGDYSFLIQNRFDLTPDILYEFCREILDNKKYVNAAETMRDKVKVFHGPRKAIELIENNYYSETG